MLNVFTLANGRLVPGRDRQRSQALASVQPDLGRPRSAHAEEKRWIAAALRPVASPRTSVDDDLEESARFYEEDNGELHIRSDFLIDDDDDRRATCASPSSSISNGVLFSVHAEDLPVFRLLRTARARASRR